MSSTSRPSVTPRPERPTIAIGELARRSGRSVHTLRWYESIGLLPGVRRDGGNRRRYDELHVGWLDLVQRLQTTGMSTAEIRRYAALVARGRSTLEERRDLLLAHRTRVSATIAEWRRALAMLDRKVDFYDDWLRHGRRPAEPAASSLSNPKSRGRR